MKKLLLLLILFLSLTVFLALISGQYPHWGFTSLETLKKDEMALRLFLHLRLPRVITAVVTGMVLGGTGYIFQMIFSNPLVEPGILGVSGGGAFGAALSMLVFGGSAAAVQTGAGLFALLGLVFSWALSRSFRYGTPVLRLILAGIAVSSLFSAGLGVIKILADPLSQLPEIVFWLLGGLWGITSEDMNLLFIITIPLLCILWLLRWRVTLLSLGDVTSHTLGVSVRLERIGILILSAGAVASVIALTGLIGWVGLIIPHIARRLTRNSPSEAFTASLLTGGIFLLLCDSVSRLSPWGEIPLGVLTSLAGALIFSVIMVKRRG